MILHPKSIWKDAAAALACTSLRVATQRGSTGWPGGKIIINYQLSIINYLLFLLAPTLFAQESISGVINGYAPVLYVDYCANSIVIGGAVQVKKGMHALLIQMQGATVDSSNSGEFGRITAYNSAGCYELVTVDAVASGTVTLESSLLKRYDPAGRLQFVSIPGYADAVVTGTLTTPAWDGSIGGVIALEVEGTLTLEAGIDASFRGFRGGRRSRSFDTLSDSMYVSDYRWGKGGEKGEGIALPIARRDAGRTPLANGGGVVRTTRASIGSSVRLDLAGGAEGVVNNANSHRYLYDYHAARGVRGFYLAGSELDRSSRAFVRLAVDAGPSIAICGGWPGEKIGARGGIPPYSYRWSPAAGLSSDTVPFPIASPAVTTRYRCETVDAAGCRSIDSID